MLSERICFVTKRINDILKLVQENEVVLSNDVKEVVGMLKKELSEIYQDLRQVEQNTNQTLSQQQYYRNLSRYVDRSDYILNGVFSNNDNLYTEIYNLVTEIQNFYNSSPSQNYFYTINAIGNINSGGGNQIMGQMEIHNHIEPSQRKHDAQQSFGHFPNRYVVGFNHEIETLLNHVLQPQDDTCFVGIVGMGGLGKTTLAKHIYHHPKVKTLFTCKAWVWIPPFWDKTSILNQIWEKGTQDDEAAEMGFDQVVPRLYAFLSSHSYLIILDYISSTNLWRDIYQSFPNKRGSTILVTTRDKDIPKHINVNVRIVEPKKLNEEDSYELFNKEASFQDKNIHDSFLQLAKKMVNKCKGLPLAIIILAHVLNLQDPNNWENINNQLSYYILNTKHVIPHGCLKDTLAWSLDELPFHLKSCVFYLRVFPEDYEIEAQKLIQMWKAECLVNDELKAKEYLDKMAQQCIVEDVKTNHEGQVYQFRIHDLFRQMFFNMNRERGIFKDTFRLAPSETLYGDDDTKCIKHFRRILESGQISLVRSVIFRNYSNLSEPILNPLFLKFRLLRVLILCHICEREMPEEIEKLIHLRYLELGGDIELSRSIGNLVNLSTLDMRQVSNTKIQLYLSKLTRLRHLYLPRDQKVIKDMEKLELERLKKLETLWNVRGGKWMLTGMSELSEVLKDICISDIRSKKHLEAVFRTPSITLEKLHKLELKWCSRLVNQCDISILRNCVSLKELKLWGRIEASTPIEFPPNIIKLELILTSIYESKVMKEISNSCLNLKILVLRNNAYKGSELEFKANTFLQLEKLALEFLGNLKSWIIEESAMPNLHHLTVKGCRHLDLYTKGWRRISNIPLQHMDLSPEFEEKLRMYKDAMYLSRVVMRIIMLLIFFSLLYQLYLYFRGTRLIMHPSML